MSELYEKFFFILLHNITVYFIIHRIYKHNRKTMDDLYALCAKRMDRQQEYYEEVIRNNFIDEMVKKEKK